MAGAVDQSNPIREVNPGYPFLFLSEGGSPVWVPAFAGKQAWRGHRAIHFVITEPIVIPAQAGIHNLDGSRSYRTGSQYGFPPARE